MRAQSSATLKIRHDFFLSSCLLDDAEGNLNIFFVLGSGRFSRVYSRKLSFLAKCVPGVK